MQIVVTTGRPTLVQSVAIEVSGQANDTPEGRAAITKLREDWLLPKGDRWRQETNRRFDDVAGASRLVLGLGRGDILTGVSLARSRLNLANILDEAHTRRLPTFVVGPPPTLTPAVNDGLRQLSLAFGDVCHRRGVPYVDTYRPLEAHDDWLTDLSAGDGTHPGQAGYGLIAWLVLHGGWHAWLGVER